MTTLFRRLIDEQELRDPRAFLPRFSEQARLLAERDGDVRLATLEPAVSTFEAWYYGQRLPNRDARRVLVAWFGHSIERLWLRHLKPLSRHEAAPSTVRVPSCTR
ncbi:hypothetical protein [Streptomyces sp. ID05-18]|uniref:hypothetical protein n=1 Tax=Streptomyces sp. ID05-18 TaxID=3028662 RepID=UPI0029ABE1FA|nr:hypothetical protein [Streptomyces sp. ID05-18]MDX3488297.1 hypothetical protein [Streptomyces sp. ID05-18]